MNSVMEYCNLDNVPQAPVVLKKAAEDCVIQTDSGKPLPVPKGTMLVPMVNAIHRNRA